MKLVTCPNCNGKDSSFWPFGPCTICEGRKKVSEERAAPVLAEIAKRRKVGGT